MTTSPLKISISGRRVLTEVTFRLVTIKNGKGQAVVVAAVEPGSETAKAGVRVGQRVSAVSDPMRPDVLWELKDRPSLRFVQDALRMQRQKPVQMVFDSLMTPTEVQALLRSSLPSGATDNAASLSSMDPASDADDPSLTIGERLAQRYQQEVTTPAATPGTSDVQKRIARRKSYLDEVEQRDDSSLGLVLAAAFLGPALIILAVASGTGYLDQLYMRALTAQ